MQENIYNSTFYTQIVWEMLKLFSEKIFNQIMKKRHTSIAKYITNHHTIMTAVHTISVRHPELFNSQNSNKPTKSGLLRLIL